MKPVQQVFALVLDKIPEFTSRMIKYNKYKNQIKQWEKSLNEIDFIKKVENYRLQQVKELIFDEFVNKIKKVNTISNYFS